VWSGVDLESGLEAIILSYGRAPPGQHVYVTPTIKSVHHMLSARAAKDELAFSEKEKTMPELL
jgi:hypothetical protein